jgi:starch synthase
VLDARSIRETADVPAASRSILVITPEATPFAKTGGLADVSGALPLALGRLGHRVTVVLPQYRRVTAGAHIGKARVTLGPDRLVATFGEHAVADRVRVVVVGCPELYDRAELYGEGGEDYGDNARRFAFLSRAALEYIVLTGERPDVVHAHDWQAGLAPVYIKTLGTRHPVIASLPVVFTIHNLAYQGLFSREWAPALDLAPEWFTVEGLEYWGSLSFLKAGITQSDLVTTVSPTYARDIRTPEHGFGFEGILARLADRLVGILNGIDVERWNPSADPFLPAPYSALELSGKRAAKCALLEHLGLPATPGSLETPVVGMVSRMVDQKGFDLLSASAGPLLERPITVAMLGSGEPRYEQEWSSLSAAHPRRIGVRIGFDDRLAHLIIAGSDIFIMPSRFEPCGLSQLYCLRYGTVPVVRRTGGLDDTVENWNPRTRRGTGFTFRDYTPEAFVEAMERALAAFADPDRWRLLQEAGMRQDHSWEMSAREYVRVYDRAIRLANRERRPAPGHGRST